MTRIRRDFNCNYDDSEMTDEQGYMILDLMDTSIIPYKERELIERRVDLKSLSKEDAEDYIIKLKENQRDNIRAGFNYFQGDIRKNLNKLKENEEI